MVSKCIYHFLFVNWYFRENSALFNWYFRENLKVFSWYFRDDIIK